MTNLWRGVAAEGFDLSAVHQQPGKPDEQRVYCRAMAEFFRKVSLLPQSQAGALMRYLNRS